MKLTVDGIAAVGFVALAMSCHAGGASLIAVDVGHSSLRPGAISARGIPEFEYNLALSRTIHDTLSSRHVSSVLIGDDGTMTNLQARTATASARGASFFLSVHHDSAQSKYLETWTWEGRGATPHRALLRVLSVCVAEKPGREQQPRVRAQDRLCAQECRFQAHRPPRRAHSGRKPRVGRCG